MLDLCKAIDCVPVATKRWAWLYGSRYPHVLGQWAVKKCKELDEPLDTAPHSLLVRKFWLKQTGKACYVPCAPLHLLHLPRQRSPAFPGSVLLKSNESGLPTCGQSSVYFSFIWILIFKGKLRVLQPCEISKSKKENKTIRKGLSFTQKHIVPLPVVCFSNYFQKYSFGETLFYQQIGFDVKKLFWKTLEALSPTLTYLEASRASLSLQMESVALTHCSSLFLPLNISPFFPRLIMLGSQQYAY